MAQLHEILLKELLYHLELWKFAINRLGFFMICVYMVFSNDSKHLQQPRKERI